MSRPVPFFVLVSLLTLASVPIARADDDPCVKLEAELKAPEPIADADKRASKGRLESLSKECSIVPLSIQGQTRAAGLGNALVPGDVKKAATPPQGTPPP